MEKEQNQEVARMIRNRIRETWSRLTDEEVSLYKLNPSEFYNRIKEKYGIDRETAEARVEEFEAASKIRKAA